ncbi:MAG: ABC1 kinase family protein [Segniliparus sp.]|uniref:ABC1 kinase family protein n=1 Tax=Segniliparus sp. TaxID=2804064 RepID=UPI003F39DB2F
MEPKTRTSRTGRLAQLGALAGKETAKRAATHAANLTRSEARAKAHLDARKMAAVERLVIALGSMRGIAVKLGQMLSVMDVGLFGPDQRQEIQEKLAALQSNVPAVDWAIMRARVEQELGPIPATFAEFCEQPVAAASIGQVYRARLHDGREVAVKAQYPDIERIIRSDLSNLRIFLAAFSRVLQIDQDVRSLSEELDHRFTEELDYQKEAASTRALADFYTDHPFIRVPAPALELSTRRVLVTEWLDGSPLSSAYDRPLGERNRIAEAVFRFYGSAPYALRMFSGDAHPGNVLLLADGRVGFLDFGLVKRIDEATAEAELAIFHAISARDGARLVALLRARGALIEDSVDVDDVAGAFALITRWFLHDETIELTPEVVNETVSVYTDSGTPEGAALRQVNLPNEHALRVRVDAQLVALLSQLRPALNFSAIAREWIDGAEPATALGREHRAWAAARP